jgi:hypothetical protein
MESAMSDGHDVEPKAISEKLLPLRISSVALLPPMASRYASCSFASASASPGLQRAIFFRMPALNPNSLATL